MNLYFLLGTAAVVTFSGCAGLKLERVPPGQSIARRLDGPRTQPTEPLAPAASADLPTPAGEGAATADPGTANPQFAGRPQIIGAIPNNPAIEKLPPLPIVGLPERTDGPEKASDAYNRGSLLMKNGQNRDAITAFEEATQLDPSYTDAWTRLTVLYEKIGQPEKARAAFRRAKGLSPQPATPAPSEGSPSN